MSTARQVALAKSVLVIAVNGGMPDTFWQTDSRIALACLTLGWTPEQAREWASENDDWGPWRDDDQEWSG